MDEPHGKVLPFRPMPIRRPRPNPRPPMIDGEALVDQAGVILLALEGLMARTRTEELTDETLRPIFVLADKIHRDLAARFTPVRA